jgi:hypothetical protein
LSIVAVLVAVCGDEGGQAEDEEVGDLHDDGGGWLLC